MTEQGEMMADRYGHPAIAERHLEQVLNAVLRTSFPGDEDQPEPAWVEALDGLAESARRHYRALVYDDPEFLAYFEQATCIGEIGRLKIGSRPARRAQTNGIDQLRAIPWVFSWMQSRHTLPGWYGLGGAIQEFLASRPDGMPMLRDMYGRWPFWTTLIDNAQMILAKADLTIARLYADLVEDQALAARVFDRIATEYRLAADAVCRVTGQGSLLERSPILKTSIERRNPYVDPLSFIQLVLLKRLRAGGEGTTGLETAVLESINGIASGLKNTG
jgi:phosphoenolpyruvate carboxylase